MTTNEARRTYRILRAAYVREQNAACTQFATMRATNATFDSNVRSYLAEVEGVQAPKPAQWVDGARAVLAYLRGADERHNAATARTAA